MRCARFVRTCGLLLVLGVAGLGDGCGPGAPPPVTKEEETKIREDMKSFHQQIRKDAQEARRGGNRKRAGH